MMPDARGTPTMLVPVPDPSSLGVVLHWMYWGDASAVEDALSSGQVSWQGLVHNIDYLDLDAPIKRIVGKWWRKWVKVERQSTRTSQSGGNLTSAWFEDDDDAVVDDKSLDDDEVWDQAEATVDASTGSASVDNAIITQLKKL